MLKALDQTRLDEQAIEPSRLGAAGTPIKETVAAIQNLLLLGKGRVKRHACRLLHQQGQVRCIKRRKRRRQIDRFEVHGIDRVVTRVITRIEGLQLARKRGLAERRVDNSICEFRLVITKSNNQKRIGRKLALEP